MKNVIEEAGGNIKDVIRPRINFTIAKEWEQVAMAQGEFFAKIKPTCTFVQVYGFINKEWLVGTIADYVISN